MTSAREREAFDQAVARGSDQLKAGNLGEAQRHFRIALEEEPRNVRVLALLGLAYFRGNQFAEARPVYEELIELAPTDAAHRLNLGLVCLKLNEAERAIEALEASRAIDPSQGRAVSYLGLAYARAGRYPDAYRSFLFAGQTDLAKEIENNLPAAQRADIEREIEVGRNPSAPAEPERAVDVAPRPARPEPESTVATAPRSASLTDSQQFVLPKVEAPRAVPGVSMISQAVDAAAPVTASSARAPTRAGGLPPRPLSELATDDLIRPEDGDEPLEIAPTGALVIRVVDRILARLDGVHVTGGDLAFEPATRRSRGHQTEERFDYGGSPLHTINGHGYLVALPGDHVFTAVALDDDILYLREDLVFAFETSLRWESGNVPGMRGKLPVVQFRGDGALALRSRRPLVRVKLASSGVLFVDAYRLAGWIGRVIPRAVVPPSGGPLGTTCVECTGEGVVLVEALPTAGATHPAVPASTTSPPPPPAPDTPPEVSAPASGEIDPELDMSSVLDEDPPPGDEH